VEISTAWIDQWKLGGLEAGAIDCWHCTELIIPRATPTPKLQNSTWKKKVNFVFCLNNKILDRKKELWFEALTATELNKTLTGYQSGQVVKRKRRCGNHLCPHHQRSDAWCQILTTEMVPETLVSFGHLLRLITNSLKLAHRLHHVRIVNTAKDKSLELE
jgi:hypothetical protein